jgi:integrase
MSVQPLVDAAGRRRSPATTPGFRTGIAPRNKGRRYPADRPTVDEIVAVMREAGRDRRGHWLTALIVVLWRAGLRIHEALSVTGTDPDLRRGSILVRHGKGDRRREVGMDAWACASLHRSDEEGATKVVLSPPSSHVAAPGHRLGSTAKRRLRMRGRAG